VRVLQDEQKPLLRAAVAPLSVRERRVMQLVCDGKSNLEIAAVLHLSPHTVKNHLKKIFKKLNVNSRGQAAAIALANGMIHPGGAA
jgi:RNA polymerase sigma factor (sigma-70 family)